MGACVFAAQRVFRIVHVNPARFIAALGRVAVDPIIDVVLVNRKDVVGGKLSARGENVVQAIDEFSPFAVDLSSSLETDGVKDENKIKEIMEIIR